MKLRQLQTLFLKEIYGEDTGLSNELLTQGKLTSTQRIHIYQNAYRSRLYEVLETDFPYLGMLLGDELFDDLIHSYISTYPSNSPSINYYGKELPTFIRSHPQLANQHIAIELCDLEWQLRTTFDSKNGRIINDDFLKSIPDEEWPKLKFQIMPGLAIHYFSMNTVDVWQSLKNEESPTINQLDYPQAWVFWRQGLITQFRSMEVDEACLLNLIIEGQNFESLCEALLEWLPEEHIPSRAFQLLTTWIKTEMLTEALS